MMVIMFVTGSALQAWGIHWQEDRLRGCQEAKECRLECRRRSEHQGEAGERRWGKWHLLWERRPGKQGEWGKWRRRWRRQEEARPGALRPKESPGDQGGDLT